MSRPTFENIDQWLFEYTEGTLSSAQESQLMDFIRVNPEVMTDLKAWQQAKVSPKATPDFSSASLIKPMPILLRPVSLMAIGVLAILMGWIGYNNYPTDILYSKANIDAQIIYVGDEDLFDSPIMFAQNQKETPAENPFFEKTEGKTESRAESNRSKINRTDKSPDLFNLSQSSLSTNTFNNSYSEEVENDELIYLSNDDDKIEIDYSQLNTIQNNFQTKADDLDNISAYLNRSKESDNEEYISSAKIISSADVNKSSMKKTFHNAYRKIKRMADQPVALQNTKNPHYHAPMMTGFKANAAMVGTAPGNRIQATSRMQWLDKSNSQLLNTLSWDGYAYALRGGIGVDVNYNSIKMDDLNNYSVGLTYSPKFSINKTVSFEPALRFKMGVVNLDPNSSVIGNKIEIDRHNIVSLFENEDQVNGEQLWYKDVGLGFMLNTKWFYAGFNADNLGRHNNNFHTGDLSQKHREHIHYTAIIGTEYQSMTRDIKVSGYSLFQSYGKLTELWVGGNFKYKWLQSGVGISTNADLGASLGTVFNRFSFHYNIDYTKSRLLNDQFLSHQVTMKIMLKPNRYAAKFLNL